MYENKIKKIDELQKEINQHRPLNEKETKQFREYFKIGLTYSSNALEGNSLTETETKIILEDGLTIGGKTLKEHFEVVGHGQAYEYLFNLVENKKLTEENILKIHELFYFLTDIAHAGKYRMEQVFITGTDFIPPSPKKVPLLMKEFAKTILSLEEQVHPVEYAALLHKKLVKIHPFVDGNGRTARLVMNLALLQHGYVITVIPPILRTDYINSLKQSDDDSFVAFISCMVYECQRDYLRLLRALREG